MGLMLAPFLVTFPGAVIIINSLDGDRLGWIIGSRFVQQFLGKALAGSLALGLAIVVVTLLLAFALAFTLDKFLEGLAR